MTKRFIILLLVCLPGATFGHKYELDPGGYYELVKSEPDRSIGEGKCRIYGTVVSNSDFTELSGVSIWQNNRILGTTGPDGKFKLIVSTNAQIYFLSEDSIETMIPAAAFEPKTSNEMKVLIGKIPVVVEKPVIYVSDSRARDVTVRVIPKGELSFQYPSASDGVWRVKTSADGLLTDQTSGAIYPYLFWEAKQSDIRILSSKPQYINTDSLIPWLESSLHGFGLNFRERADFITFWAPRASQNKYIAVHWVFDEDCDLIFGELAIDPKPDFLRRVYFVFREAYESEIKIDGDNTQAFVPTWDFEGLRVLEWGGVEMTTNAIQPW